MYKTLVERRSRQGDDLRKVIATGDACIDAPEGKVCIDPKSRHHFSPDALDFGRTEARITVRKDYGTISHIG
jgi:branched-chain amino acid transport system substrate-binding protein